MALPTRRGSRFPASLFEPTALWDPVSEFEYLRERMGRLHEQISQQGPEQSPWQPDIEVDETEEFYLVKAELPGITRDNVELQVDEHSLTITGSSPHRGGRSASCLVEGQAPGCQPLRQPCPDAGGLP